MSPELAFGLCVGFGCFFFVFGLLVWAIGSDNYDGSTQAIGVVLALVGIATACTGGPIFGMQAYGATEDPLYTFEGIYVGTYLSSEGVLHYVFDEELESEGGGRYHRHKWFPAVDAVNGLGLLPFDSDIVLSPGKCYRIVPTFLGKDKVVIEEAPIASCGNRNDIPLGSKQEKQRDNQ